MKFFFAFRSLGKKNRSNDNCLKISVKKSCQLQLKWVQTCYFWLDTSKVSNKEIETAWEDNENVEEVWMLKCKCANEAKRIWMEKKWQNIPVGMSMWFALMDADELLPALEAFAKPIKMQKDQKQEN